MIYHEAQMKTYNLGIIGAGKYGRVLMRYFQQDERANITWVNSASESTTKFATLGVQATELCSLQALRHFLEALHIFLRARDEVLFHQWPHDLHNQSLELKFCFHCPNCLMLSQFDELVSDDVICKIIFINAIETVGFVAMYDLFDQGELTPAFFIGQV